MNLSAICSSNPCGAAEQMEEGFVDSAPHQSPRHGPGTARAWSIVVVHHAALGCLADQLIARRLDLGSGFLYDLALCRHS
jgi:hypothetical protein